MKKNYMSPAIKVIMIDQTDIIATSIVNTPVDNKPVDNFED